MLCASSSQAATSIQTQTVAACQLEGHLQAEHWSAVEDEAFWAARGEAMPRVPAFRALLLLSRDALQGEPLSGSGLPESTSATAFLEHVLAWWERTHGAPPPAAEPGAWPPWAAVAAMGSPLGALALHALKLQCPLALSQLWSAFIGAIAVDHCETLTAFGGPHVDVSAAALRGGAGDDPATAPGEDATREHTLHFEAPHLVTVLDDLAGCIARLAALDDAPADGQALGTIQEEGEGGGEGAADGEAVDDRDRGSSEHAVQTGAGAVAVPGEGGDQHVAGTAAVNEAHDDAANVTSATGGNAVPTEETATCGGASPAKPTHDSSSASESAEGRMPEGTGDPAAAWACAGGVVVEAAVRGAVEALRDVAPSHALAVLLFTGCQVRCPLGAGSECRLHRTHPLHDNNVDSTLATCHGVWIVMRSV